jgi:hypothetical protein
VVDFLIKSKTGNAITGQLSLAPVKLLRILLRLSYLGKTNCCGLIAAVMQNQLRLRWRQVSMANADWYGQNIRDELSKPQRLYRLR